MEFIDFIYKSGDDRENILSSGPWTEFMAKTIFHNLKLSQDPFKYVPFSKGDKKFVCIMTPDNIGYEEYLNGEFDMALLHVIYDSPPADDKGEYDDELYLVDLVHSFRMYIRSNGNIVFEDGNDNIADNLLRDLAEHVMSLQ